MYWDNDGKEITRRRKRTTYSFTKLDYNEIPQDVVSRYFPKPRTPAEIREVVIEKLVLGWFADNIADSFEPSEGFWNAVAHGSFKRTNDAFIESGLHELFPDLDEHQLDLLLKTVRVSLDQPMAQELVDAANRKSIMEFVARETPQFVGVAKIMDFFYDVHIARKSSN
ncbi:MAG: hypothetical protein HQ582_05115 [Planctomycetes bacterium]|nr:hypothetical protein [Planctomycetota bacterium]